MIPVYYLLHSAIWKCMFDLSQVVPQGLTMRLCIAQFDPAGQSEVHFFS